MIEDVDVIVIGSGQGGKPLAKHFSDQGKHVVMFERDRWGGSCVNFGCTPSKALLAAAHNAGRARSAGPLGVHCDVRVDAPAVFERVRAVREQWRSGAESGLREAKVDLVHAHARFTGVRTVSGGGREVRAPIVIIDVGTCATIPPVAGIDRVPYITNHAIFDLKDVPANPIVIGGGYIGLELGQGLQRLGGAVTLVNFGKRVMDREEEDGTAILQAQLEADGMKIVFCSAAKRVEHDGKTFTLETDSGAVVTGDALLVAVGRTPNTSDLDASRSNVELLPNGMVKVDEYLQTTCEGVYAIGDAAGQPAFTHVSWEDYRRLKSTLAGTPRKKNDRVLTYTTFTEPQIARSGYTEAEAKAAGIDASSRTVPLTDVARGTEWNLDRGFYRLVVDNATDKLIGATFVGYETGELIHVLALAIEYGHTWMDVDRLVLAHPAFAEGIGQVARLFEK